MDCRSRCFVRVIRADAQGGWWIRRFGGNWVADTILVTGGAGFIGRHVSRALLRRGHRVRVLDSLIEQVHGGRAWPEGLDSEVELLVGDVRDEAALIRALKGVDKVVHLAAEV